MKNEDQPILNKRADQLNASIRKMDEQGRKIEIAREAILQDLRRRWKEGPIPDKEVSVPRDISRFYKPQTNYFCGIGVMDCPICKTGRLHYDRSYYNGHVFAQCTTDGCVWWRE